jgi:hypothetical protein
MTCFGSSESLSSEDFGHDDDDISNFSSDESCINVREPYTQAQQWNELTEPPYLVQSLEPMIVSPSSWNPITKTSQPTVLHQKSHPPRDVADRSPSVSSVSPQHSHYTGEALLRKMARGGTFADEYIQRINFKEPWPYDLRGLYQPHPIAPLPKSPSQSLPSKLATALSSLLLVLRGEVVERKRRHNSQIPHPPWGTYSFRSVRKIDFGAIGSPNDILQDDDDLDWDDDDGDLATWLDRVVHRNKRQYETCLPGVGIPLEDYEERSALSYTRQIDDFPWEVLEPPVGKNAFIAYAKPSGIDIRFQSGGIGNRPAWLGGTKPRRIKVRMP